MVRAILYFFVITALLGLPWVSSAQGEQHSTATPYGEELLLFQDIPSVYGASKYEQKVTEAPSSISIITAEEIQKYGYRTLADILKSVRGFYVTYDRNYHFIGVRGFSRSGDYDARVLLLVDGHRINDNIYDSATAGTDAPIDVDLIQRVEVVRGPSSSIYGTSAFFGVINVITKKGRDLKGAELSGEAGSFSTYKGRLSYGNRFRNGLEMLLSGTAYDSKGDPRLYYPEFSAVNNGIAEDADDDQYRSFFAKVSLQDFTLEGSYSSREKGIPTAPWGIEFNDPRNRTTDERGYVYLKYDHTFEDQSNVMARLFYDRYYFEGDYVVDYDPPITLNRDLAWGYWWGGELQATKRMRENHKLTFGAEYRDNFRQDQVNLDVDPASAPYLEDRRDSRIWAVYLQDEFNILTNLILNAGARYDHYSTFGGTTNPRLALIYEPRENTTLKLLYGEAFRAPNAYELYYHDGGETSKPSPNLEPETITTYEAVYEHYIGDHMRTTASVYYYRIKDLITQESDPTDICLGGAPCLVYNNVENVNAKGLELELENKWVSGLQGRVSYAFQDTEDEATGSVLPNSPRHLAKVNVIVPLIGEKTSAGIEGQFMGKRKTVFGSEVGSFFVTNLTLSSRNVLKDLDISASIYNLFDEKYGDPGSEEHDQDTIEQDGRSFRLKITYAF